MLSDGKSLQPLVPGSARWLAVRRRSDFWTERDLALLRQYYPDRTKLGEALPHRTFRACETKFRLSWPDRRQRGWTGTEIVTLRRIYPVVTWPEVKHAFPNRTEDAIRYQAGRLRLYRPTLPFRPSGNVIVDTVKQRARAEGLSMRFLDLEAGSRHYFRHGSLSGHVRTSAILSAMKILGGRLEFVWEE